MGGQATECARLFLGTCGGVSKGYVGQKVSWERYPGLYCRIKYSTYVIDVDEVAQERAEIHQLRIVGVVEPRRDGDGIVGVENV